jgi:hypothetical protein
VATVVAVATAGVSASVLVSGVGATAPGCTTQPSTTNRVVVTCGGLGGEVTLPGGREVTVDLAGGSGGRVGDREGGRGAVVHATWTPESDVVVWAALGSGGASGTVGHPGGFGGDASIVLPRPSFAQRFTRGAWWWLVAGGGGGRGTSTTLGAGGDGGADPVTGAGGNGVGGATGGTAASAGSGSGGGLPGLGPLGGLGVLGGGSGGSGFNGGGGGGANGGGGGAGASHANVGTATYAPATTSGDGWARFSWTLPTPPQVTSAADAAFVAGQPGSFAITATGDPVPQLSVGPLPSGLAFTDDGDGSGVISGVPSAGTGGDTIVDVTAANGHDPDATQQLRLHIATPAAPVQTTPPPPFTPDLSPVTTYTETQQTSEPDPTPDPELVPVAGETVVVAPVSGTVLIRHPDGTITELKEGEEIPVGSIVDTRDGVVRLTAARDATGVVQTAIFWNAIFQVTQQADVTSGRHRHRGRSAAVEPKKLLTELRLRQKPSECAPSRHRARAAGSKKKGKRKRGGLWGDGKGRFSVRGDSSSATVRGTKWYVENRCDGTYTRVVRGVVAVRDFTKKKTIVLRAGGTYTAKKRGS